MFMVSDVPVIFESRTATLRLPDGRERLRSESRGDDGETNRGFVRSAAPDEYRVEYVLLPAYYVELVIRVHSPWS